MPSRKKSYRRRGRKATKRSLRFTPKFVIKERSDTIEDTLNATIMGRKTFRIPGDVANIIQGYEGSETLYFNFDPVFNSFNFSTTNPLKDGGKTYIRTDIPYYNNQRQDYTYFIRVKVGIFYYSNITGNDMFRRDVALAITSTKELNDTRIEEYILEKYYNQFANDLKNKFIEAKKFSLSKVDPKIVISVEKEVPYPFELEDGYEEIIFDKAI